MRRDVVAGRSEGPAGYLLQANGSPVPNEVGREMFVRAKNG